MANFIWGDAGAQLTPESIAAQRKIAQAMMARGADYSPVGHWTQGLARATEGMLGGLDAARLDMAEKQNATAEKELLASLISPGAPTAVAPAPAAVGAAPSVAPAVAPAAASPDASLPRGIRNNNPLNIESGTFTAGMPGYAGSDGRFARFETPEQGVGAANRLLDIYEKKHGLNTVAGIVGRWAPTSDGNNVSAYAANVSRQLGIDPNAPITPEMRPRLIAAMGQHENGRPINVGATSPAAPAAVASTDPAALPPNAQSAEGYAIPGQPSPGVQAVAAATPAGLNPRLLTAMASPYVSDGTKKILGIMLQSQLSSEGVTPIDAGNKIILTDKRGNVVRELPKGEPNKGPEYGVIGKDQFGNEQYGWRDPRTQSVTPGPQSAAAATQPVITGADGQPIAIPQGQDPKVYRDAASKAGAAGALPANFDDTSKLRTEISQLPSYKNIAQAAPIYRSMADAAGRNTKAADLNMVYGLGKIMDPGSVVREGEIQMANNAQGWQEKLNGLIAQINGQGGLTPEGRQALMAEAHSRMQSYKMMYDQDAQRYRGIAQRNRANPEDVVADFGTFEPWTAPKAGAPVTVDGYTIKAK